MSHPFDQQMIYLLYHVVMELLERNTRTHTHTIVSISIHTIVD
jgi:hypothetical protein